MSTIICALCDAISTPEETGGLITGICPACDAAEELRAKYDQRVPPQEHGYEDEDGDYDDYPEHDDEF